MGKIITFILKSIAATLFIGVGCIIYANYPTPVGAFFFSIGLLLVLYTQSNLFTGKVGYINSKKSLIQAILVLLINCAAAAMFLLYPPITTINFIAKMNNAATLLRSILCGVLVHFSVDRFKKGQPWVTLIGVPAFILCGGEHCIANIIYLVLTRTFTIQAFVFVFFVAIGNSIGALGLDFLLNRIENNKNLSYTNNKKTKRGNKTMEKTYIIMINPFVMDQSVYEVHEEGVIDPVTTFTLDNFFDNQTILNILSGLNENKITFCVRGADAFASRIQQELYEMGGMLNFNTNNLTVIKV